MLQLILASGSAARGKMLADAGVPFTSVRPDVNERDVEAPLVAGGAAPAEIALALARAKALSVSKAHRERLVLGCDQTLSLGSEMFHKPADAQAARAQLLRLSGRTHRLHSAAVLARDGAVLWEYVETCAMTMRALDEAFVERYCAAVGDAALASVGAYHVEGLGVQLFERIEGDFFSIVGLPLLPLLGALCAHGVLDA